MKASKLKKGAILSETSFYKVIGHERNGNVKLQDDLGNDLTISPSYVENILSSADHFNSSEKLTMTQLAELFINSPRVAMTVAYFKQDKKKLVRDFKAEKAAKIKEIQEASLSTASSLLEDLIENPISRVIPGELRVMKGRHYGNVDDFGRISFTDMEKEKGDKPEHDARLRQVDPRTIQYIIVGGTKFEIKK